MSVWLSAIEFHDIAAFTAVILKHPVMMVGHTSFIALRFWIESFHVVEVASRGGATLAFANVPIVIKSNMLQPILLRQKLTTSPQAS